MCQCKLCVLCALLCFSAYPVTPFNVDSFNYASYETPSSGGPESMFGFSIALHKERNNGWLIVGAPEAQTGQPGVIRGGAVYRCPTNWNGACEEIPFDTKGDNRDTHNNLVDNKTEQWFGATVSSSNRAIVACAPRYTWFPRGRSRRDPVGTCYVSNANFADFNEYSPCRTYQWGYHRQGSCQAGFSAAINSVGDRLFIGSPGSWYWQGQMYSVDAHATFDFKPSLFSATYGHEGQVHQQSLESRPAVFSTTEGTEKDDDSYMGYSTIVGPFLNNGEEQVAVGMPRGNKLKGKILLFHWNLTNFIHNLTSDQVGSYYGYALAASDVDGDSRLDLIIGAPMYTVQNNKDIYDVGRVYVYHQVEQGKFVESYTIDGFNSKARFGQALTSLGDINQDGFGDFAVGAPYDGKGNRGAVYIYHGSNKGVRKKFSQVILAEDVIPGPVGALRTFGFALTGGLDLDGNEYPDMAVGAYLSNRAFFFRSRPVIKVEASVEFLSSGVDIVNTDYVLKSSGKNATKTQIQFCSRYYGKGIPSSLDLGVEYILDTKKLINPRMGFVDDEGQNRKNTTVRLSRDQKITCETPIDVYVRSDIRDKLTTLVVEAKYWLKDDANLSPSYLQQLTRNPRATLIPVLDLNSPPSKKDSISIHNNCGKDNVCIPNLVLTVNPSVPEYSLDSKEDFFLDITVTNNGEDAFEATVEVKYPDGFFYTTESDVQVVSHVLCNNGENNTVKCDIGNPVPNNRVVHFKLFWQPDYSKELRSKLHFDVSVNSTNEEPVGTLSDNKQRVEISIYYDIIEEIKGWSSPNEIVFSPATSLYVSDFSNQTKGTASQDRLTEDVIGPQVIYLYTLTNKGQTNVKATEIFFVWPAMTSTYEDFLYLLEPPHFRSHEKLNLQCGPIPHNHREFLLTRKKEIWQLIPKSILPAELDTESSGTSTETSKQVGATIGGSIVTSDEKLNIEVDKSGDSSKVIDWRHQNKSHEETMTLEGSTRIQIFESSEVSGNFKNLEIGGKNYAYRCFKTVQGIEQEVDCGADFTFENLSGLLQTSSQYQEEGNVKFWCFEQDSTGESKKVQCGDAQKIPVRVEEGETTVQIFGGGQEISQKLAEENYHHQKINGSDFIYRCFRRINGREEEIPCGKNFSFSTVDLPWVLQQSGIHQEGDIRYACLGLDPEGNLRRTTCQNVPKIKVKTEIFTSNWGKNDTHYWNETGTYFIGPKYNFTKVQVFATTEQVSGSHRSLHVGGQEFFYRCFRSRYGNEENVDCGNKFFFGGLDLSLLLETVGVDEYLVKHFCLEPDSLGNLVTTSCQGLPKIPVVFKRFTKVQVFQGGEEIRRQLEDGFYRHQIIDERDFIYRCFDREKEVDCGEDFSLARFATTSRLLERTGVQEEGHIRYTCLEPDTMGKFKSVDCGRLPKIRFKTQVITTHWKSNGTHYWNDTGVYRLGQTYNWETVQVLQGGNYKIPLLVGEFSKETLIGDQEFLYRCFKNSGQVSCGPNFSLSGINLLSLISRVRIQREDDVRYFCLEMDGSGNWVDASCSGLPRIQIRGASTSTIETEEILRRCLNLVDGRWQDVDCRSGRFQTGGTFVEDCFQTINDRRERINCSEVPVGAVFKDTFTGTQQTTQQLNSQSGSPSYNQNYGEESEEYEDYGPQTPRNPQTYGKYDGRGPIEGTGVAGAAQGGGFTAGVLELGNFGGSSGGSQSGSHWSETHHIPPVYNNIGDNVPTQSPSPKNWHHGRRKRQVIADTHPSIGEIKKAYPCKNLECVYIRCTIENLKHDKPLVVALRGRLNAKVLREMKLENGLEFSSMMLARVRKVPYLVSVEDSEIAKQEVETTVKTPEEIKSETVPLWVVVLSAVAGTIILLLIIFLLYKLGFFKRNRPSSAPERQPLNRNGYHHGDEAL